jgi:hypothetical protein
MTFTTAVHHVLAGLRTQRELPEFNATLASPGEHVLIKFECNGRVNEYHGTVVFSGTRTMRVTRDNKRQTITVYAHGLHGAPRIGELGETDHEVISIETDETVLW